MKVVVLSTMYLRSKSDTRGLMVSEFNRSLIDLGFDVSVVAPMDEKTPLFEVIDSVKVYRFNYFFPKKFQKLAYGNGIPANLRYSWLAKFQVLPFCIFFFLKSLKVCRDAEIIHCQWTSVGVIGYFVGKILRKPVFLTVRRASLGFFMSRIEKFILSRVNYVFFNSSYTLNICSESVKIPSFSVLNNSIDFNKFYPFKVERKYNQKIVGTMGLFVEKKGFEFLITAMTKVDAVLLIAGHGPFKRKYEEIIKNLNLEKKVFLVGEISTDKTPKFFNSLDVFVLPSIIDSKGETETLGVVLIEALACGKPVIGSKVGGIVDIIDDSCGVFVKPGDSVDISEKLNFILKDSTLQKKLSRNSRAYALKKFSNSKLKKGISEVYSKYGKGI